MSYPLEITPEAEADSKQAYLWYESQRTGLGMEFLARLEQAFERISHSPEIHTVTYRHVRQTLLRKFPYVVCYVF